MAGTSWIVVNDNSLGIIWYKNVLATTNSFASNHYIYVIPKLFPNLLQHHYLNWCESKPGQTGQEGDSRAR